MQAPTSNTVLQVLPKPRLIALGRDIDIVVPPTAPKGEQVKTLHRQWLVEAVVAPKPESDEATLVRMVCLDDDSQGRMLEVLWELELGAKVHKPEAHGLGGDRPRRPAAATLQSRIHEPWARLLSSTMEDRLRYAASDCFETFPFPEPNPCTVIPGRRAALALISS